MNTLGIDIGTSGCKAGVFTGDGRLAGWAKREYALALTVDGGAELDSEKVLEACFEVIATAAKQAGGVGAIGISSQGEAVTAMDANGRPLFPAMVSSDSRPLKILEACTAALGADRLYEITGHTAHPMFTLFKLWWLRQNRPEIWRAARRFLCFEDLLALRLGVGPAMGWPLAGRTMLFDVRKHCWSEEILGILGLDDSHLARPLPSGSISGEIPGGLCARLGLQRGCILATGGHDQTCAALGAGAVRPGLAMYATGTVECICPALDQAVFSTGLRQANLCTYDFTLPGVHSTVAFCLTGGNILQWFRDQFGQPELERAAAGEGNVYDLLLESAGTDPSPLQVLPYFTPSGTPYFDSNTPGAILGLRLGTGRREILRGLLEGVAMEMRLNLEILESAGIHIAELRAVGGGAASAIWNQLKADVLGKEVHSMRVAEAGCFGAAVLARSALTGESAAGLAARAAPAGRFSPQEKLREIYAEKFARYRTLRAALAPLYPPA